MVRGPPAAPARPGPGGSRDPAVVAALGGDARRARSALRARGRGPTGPANPARARRAGARAERGHVMLHPAQGADTLRALVSRELKIRYKGSALGLLWAWLSPLGTVLILHLLFTRVVPLQIP